VTDYQLYELRDAGFQFDFSDIPRLAKQYSQNYKKVWKKKPITILLELPGLEKALLKALRWKLFRLYQDKSESWWAETWKFGINGSTRDGVLAGLWILLKKENKL
jgi:hypothetical protein